MSLHTYIYLKSINFITSVIATANYNWLLTILISTISFFEPISAMLFFIIFAVFIDLTSGLCKAWKLKSKITSWRLRDTIIKLFLYLTLVMIVYGIQNVCLWGLPLSNIVASFILFAESVSIAENIDEISNNKLGLGKFIKRLRSKWMKSNDIEK